MAVADECQKVAGGAGDYKSSATKSESAGRRNGWQDTLRCLNRGVEVNTELVRHKGQPSKSRTAVTGAQQDHFKIVKFLKFRDLAI